MSNWRYYNEANTKVDLDSRSNGFLRACTLQIRQQAKDGVPINDVRVIHRKREFTMFQVMTAYPNLMVGLTRSRLQAGQFSRLIREHGLQGISDGSAHALATTGQRHALAKELNRDLRNGRTLFGKPRRVQIPKPLKISGHLTEQEIAHLRRHGPDDRQSGEFRQLTIHTNSRRAVGYAITQTLSTYLEESWSNTVIGYRPGVSLVDGAAALDHGVRRSGRRTLLYVDLSKFFDTIPTAKLRQVLSDSLGYDRDPQIAALIDQMIGRGSGIAQGCPLSPLLANVYAAAVLDPICQEHGPTIRYADDFVIGCDSVAHARAVFADLVQRLKPTGLLLNQKKSVIQDLTIDQWLPVKPGEPVSAMPWLGMIPQFDGQGLGFRLHDQALRKLALHLAEKWRDTKTVNSDAFDSYTNFVSYGIQIVQGWYEHHGWLDISSRQKQLLGQIIDQWHLSRPAILRKASQLLKDLKKPGDQDAINQLVQALDTTGRKKKSANCTWRDVGEATPDYRSVQRASTKRAEQKFKIRPTVSFGPADNPTTYLGRRLGRDGDATDLDDPEHPPLPARHIIYNERRANNTGAIRGPRYVAATSIAPVLEEPSDARSIRPASDQATPQRRPLHECPPRTKDSGNHYHGPTSPSSTHPDQQAKSEHNEGPRLPTAPGQADTQAHGQGPTEGHVKETAARPTQVQKTARSPIQRYRFTGLTEARRLRQSRASLKNGGHRLPPTEDGLHDHQRRFKWSIDDDRPP